MRVACTIPSQFLFTTQVHGKWLQVYCAIMYTHRIIKSPVVSTSTLFHNLISCSFYIISCSFYIYPLPQSHLLVYIANPIHQQAILIVVYIYGVWHVPLCLLQHAIQAVGMSRTGQQRPMCTMYYCNSSPKDVHYYQVQSTFVSCTLSGKFSRMFMQWTQFYFMVSFICELLVIMNPVPFWVEKWVHLHSCIIFLCV